MVCLGLESGAAGWKVQTNPLSYDSTPQTMDLSRNDHRKIYYWGPELYPDKSCVLNCSVKPRLVFCSCHWCRCLFLLKNVLIGYPVVDDIKRFLEEFWKM